MNIESFREFCLSLGEVEEKLPFVKMPGGDDGRTSFFDYGLTPAHQKLVMWK